MPPRRRTIAESLTADELASLTAALADGKRATVYLREGIPSLNLAPGASARVVSIDGTTLTVKPTGINDELPYEADELRITKAAPPPPEKPAKATPRKPKPAPAAPKPAAATPRPATPKPATPQAAAPKSTPAKASTPAKSSAAKPARRTAAKKPPASVTVTLFGSSDNEWSVAVTRNGRKPARSRSVAPDSVESAMRELGDAAALDAASSILNAAREEAQRRVDELSRELAAAREALAALDGAPE